MPFNFPSWLLYAASSGAYAALNGAFAKLTTTDLTSSWASAISRSLGQDESNYIVDLLIRVSFFLMNLTFNGVMWGLFTRALTLANSTVRVSVINTSANFIMTAVLGLVVFGEKLPGLWWIGAGLLVAGSVIIGRRDEDSQVKENEAKDSRGSQGVTTQSDQGTRRESRKRRTQQ